MHTFNFCIFSPLKQNGDNIDAAIRECLPAPSLLIVEKEGTVHQVLLVAEQTALLDIPIVNLCSVLRMLLASYYVFHRAYSNALHFFFARVYARRHHRHKAHF